MKIKLAILEKDTGYLTRIINVFSTKYADKFELYSFTDPELAFATVESARIDALVASDAFDIDVDKLPSRVAFAYFVESPGVETVRDRSAICKFQKVDLIYKQILSLYAETATALSGMKIGENDVKMIVFSSPCGGTGTSTMAAACAVHYAGQGKRVLYLNLESFDSSAMFFAAEGQYDMSDIVFALKSRKANLSMKLESCVKCDQSGVFFYSPVKIALDRMELSKEDIQRLISELRITGSYDYIIVDMDFSLDKDILAIYRQAHSLVWVSNGSTISNVKTVSAFRALSTLEANADLPLQNRLNLIYNKFSNKSSQMLGDLGIKLVGGAPRFAHAQPKQILEHISAMDMFDNLI